MPTMEYVSQEWYILLFNERDRLASPVRCPSHYTVSLSELYCTSLTTPAYLCTPLHWQDTECSAVSSCIFH